MRALLLLCCLATASIAAVQDIRVDETLEGFWTGAFVHAGNSVQLVEAEITREGETLVLASSIPDWIYDAPLQSEVSRRGDVLSFETPRGTATVVFDAAYGELTGSVTDGASTFALHLKKTLRPPRPAVRVEPVAFDVGDLQLPGAIVWPEERRGPLPCVILVHGRGCSTHAWQLERARVLARHGVAVVAFDKRGSRGTGIDCTDTTLDDHARDVSRILEQVRAREGIDAARVGLVGYSAGGWVVPRVARQNPDAVAFLVTVVGPATSVKQQQIDGALAWAPTLGTTELGRRQVVRYTELMFATSDLDAVFEEMAELLAQSESERWRGWLEPTDIPHTPEDIPRLWVNRFENADPADALTEFDGPYLSILGERDDVVPYRAQIARLQEIFDAAGRTDYRVRVLPGAGHGLEHGDLSRDLGPVPELGGRVSYHKFDRVAYGAIAEIVLFLRDQGILATSPSDR